MWRCLISSLPCSSPFCSPLFLFLLFFSPWVVSSSNFRIYDSKGTPVEEEVETQRGEASLEVRAGTCALGHLLRSCLRILRHHGSLSIGPGRGFLGGYQRPLFHFASHFIFPYPFPFSLCPISRPLFPPPQQPCPNLGPLCLTPLHTSSYHPHPMLCQDKSVWVLS